LGIGQVGRVGSAAPSHRVSSSRPTPHESRLSPRRNPLLKHALTESPLAILKAAECTADEPALPRAANHHDLVRLAVEAAERDATTGGQLGGLRSIARRSYQPVDEIAVA
jgi:hypothetical protein